jgi:hypothetical protein
LVAALNYLDATLRLYRGCRPEFDDGMFLSTQDAADSLAPLAFLD